MQREMERNRLPTVSERMGTERPRERLPTVSERMGTERPRESDKQIYMVTKEIES